MKKTINGFAKQLVNGSLFGIGLTIAVIGVTAFQSLGTNPSDSGNQSLSSPIPANMINYNDCQTKSDWIDTPNEFVLSCDAGYAIIDHDCELNMPQRNTTRYGRAYCISERTSSGIHQLRIQSRMYNGSATTTHRNTSGTDYISRAGGHATVMCCKIGLN